MHVFFLSDAMTISLLSSTSQQFSALVYERLQKGRDHALSLYSEWYRSGTIEGKEALFANCPQLKEAICALIDTRLPEISLTMGEGDTKKFLVRFADGKEVESVLIPMNAGYTQCISSQVGCRMGCTFCETGRMGLLRNLTVEEIIVQVFLAFHHFHCGVRNIVFMGMGEPFDNYDNVMAAIQILMDPAGFNFGASHITVSTSGRVEEMARFTQDAPPSLNLAVSVNASNDAVRSKVMPINQKANMQSLYQTMAAYCQHPRRSIFAEYVLLEGINDSLDAADELAAYLRGLRVKINLIPYNPQRRDRFAAPTLDVVRAFQKRLQDHGYSVFARITRGQEIRAACGQLGKRQKLILTEADHEECPNPDALQKRCSV